MEKITSVNNNLIIKILKYKDRKVQFKEQKYLVEGLNIVREALKYHLVDTILVTKKTINEFREYDNVIEISDNVANKLSDLKTSQEVFAICNMKTQFIEKSNVLILDDIQDPGNLGTILRSAIAFDFKNIICSKNSVSVYNSKVLRAAQGNHFKLNIEYVDLDKTIRNLKEQNYLLISTSLSKENNFDKSQVAKKQHLALVLGNEGSGIKQSIVDICDKNFLLETNKEVESLNIAVAGSIIMFKLSNEN
ncbi:TrmH family RNA methyltransferase [Spiroplasma tabanidicola]|uniref:RNA methyltransferase n=1 Tax=Spiroplasma tabanidicola TaxID=324079 RepID=A0A6I6CB64_9MOLU|nr:RNA methyltransferase [Spiroplasma tabanidicola]QGS52171.1 RNA methyltransferase [Spiroplasma tabanidicola]